ncbi:unnamed protein product [Peronospora belbahrii]|uniref:RRM domain-containing protein n=1 Tax=Peronospora belbahrii TaxID=622444 RepID=A0ABN8DCA9_9STRA|nr:unnamed protein product [Peronospora belbahrii]
MATPSGGDSSTSFYQQETLKTEIIPDSKSLDHLRLFVVCGRGCKVDELRALFLTCGPIKHLHLALDRSKKSRGFAFLQYEDQANAVEAIEKLDHMKMDNGHILKVTIAKERPMGGHGKLKRNQHAHDLDEKKEKRLDEDDGGIEARLPGKRQRPSPPAVALPLETNCMTPAVLLEKHRLEGFQADAVTMESLRTETMTASQLPLSSLEVCNVDMMKPDLNQIQLHQVVHAMVLTVEQHEANSGASRDRLFTVYQQIVSMPSQVKKQKEPEDLSVGFLKSKEKTEEENSTDLLASSIRSVSLVSTAMTARGSPFDAVRTLRVTTRDGGVIMPPRRTKHHLRRRRQSLDNSESSTGSDSSGACRKRSNTTTSSRQTSTANLCAKPEPLSPPRKFSDQSDIRLSADALKAELARKKQCKRQSSDNGIEEPYRLAKQQATQERRAHDGLMVDQRHTRPGATDINKSYGEDRDMKLKSKLESVEPARTKLFFTSTYKFTKQELEAMFVVYGDFESAHLVKSFGRVKTMAYIHYSKPCTAALVVKSFREELSQGDQNRERPEFMTLSFAHETGELQLQQREKPVQSHVERALGCSTALYSSLPNSPVPSTSTNHLSSAGKDRLWVLLLYDRYLATHMLSSVVSSLSGMEYMDIKVVKSTGEAQGVAFVKFDSDTSATQAALQLHQMELPLGSGKFLQAIVILAPSLFSTTHGNGSTSTQESLRLDHAADERVVTGSSEDVDLRAVEARFAHLMRSTELPYTREGPHFHHYSSPPFPRRATPSDHELPMAAGVLSHSSEFHTGVSTGLEYYPMQPVTYPPPPLPQTFQPYATFGLETYHQLPQYRGFGGNASGWMETIPYYQGGAQQYPISCALEQEMAFPVVDNTARAGNSCTVSPKLFSTSEKLDAEDANRNCSNQTSFSIHVSTCEPLELVNLVSAVQDCPGVVSFAKDAVAESKLTGYTVEFSNKVQALEAQRKLDGTMCGGQMLRVAKNTLTRQRGSGGGGKARAGSGRRKRQRVDPRTRK